MALVSFKLLLATRRLSIFSPEVVVFTDPFLSILGMYMSAVISDAGSFSRTAAGSRAYEGMHMEDINHIIIPAYVLSYCSVK